MLTWSELKNVLDESSAQTEILVLDSPFVANASYKMACVTFREGRYDESIRQLQEICQAFAAAPRHPPAITPLWSSR